MLVLLTLFIGIQIIYLTCKVTETFETVIFPVEIWATRGRDNILQHGKHDFTPFLEFGHLIRADAEHFPIL